MKKMTRWILLTAGAVFAQEDYNTWTGHENIILNTKASGANITGNLLNYPLLVRLDSANASAIFNGARTGGIDIRFGKPSGARLRFERERWDATAKKAEFWVLMDTLRGNDSGTAVRIHWGNSTAADSSKSSGVFSAGNGFLAVWHMNQATTAAGDSLVDATGAGHRAVLGLEGAGAAAPAQGTGGVGLGKTFLGEALPEVTLTTGAYYTVSNADSALNLNTNIGPFTISAWAKPAICDPVARMGLLTKYANVNTGPTGGRAYCLQTANVSGNWRLTMDPLAFADTSSTSTTTEYVADVACMQDEWTYLAASYNSNSVPPTPDETGAANLKMSKFGPSGPELTTGFTAQQQPRSVGKNANVYIGRIHNLDRFFRGTIDEIRISNVERSEAWNKMDYEAQRIGGRAVFVGTVPPVALASQARGMPGFAIRASEASVRFLIPAGALGARVTVLDLAGREVWSRAIPAGSREIAWDGRTGSGRAPAGSYLARITLGDRVALESKVVRFK